MMTRVIPKAISPCIEIERSTVSRLSVVANPGALSHYSIALRDAIEACGLPVIEVYMTNIYAREEFRRHSFISAVCRATIVGAGAGGYHLALEALPWITR